jgi:hypothetical protein
MWQRSRGFSASLVIAQIAAMQVSALSPLRCAQPDT